MKLGWILTIFCVKYCFGFTGMKVNRSVKTVVRSVSSSESKHSVKKSITTKSNVVISPTFFPSAVEFRDWLVKHHEVEKELWLGLHKKSSGLQSVTYDEAVDQMLCFGWIDGTCRSIDEESYTHRISPRNSKKSNWSAININKMKVLTKAGLVMPAGLKSFEKWQEKQS